MPWDDEGHFLRFSATFAAKDNAAEIKAIDEMKGRLKALRSGILNCRSVLDCLCA